MAGRFLVAGAIAVIALLTGLWFLMHDRGEPVAAARPHADTPVAVAPPPPPAVTTVPAKRTPTTPVVPTRPTHHDTPLPAPPTVAPTLAEDAAIKPPSIAEALKEQVLFTEGQILECNEKALKAGKRLDGEAAFGFTLARKGAKIVIESTGIEYTNFDQPTTDCLRDSANAMVFDTLPEGVEALTAYRRVNFVDGALQRQALSDFGVIRPPPPPPPPKP